MLMVHGGRQEPAISLSGKPTILGFATPLIKIKITAHSSGFGSILIKKNEFCTHKNVLVDHPIWF